MDSRRLLKSKIKALKRQKRSLVKSEKKHKRREQQEVTTFMFTNETLKAAIHEYCTPSTKQATVEKYGHIQDWNVTHVTDMTKLFEHKDGFNEDISNWDVSNVTTMDLHV